MTADLENILSLNLFSGHSKSVSIPGNKRWKSNYSLTKLQTSKREDIDVGDKTSLAGGDQRPRGPTGPAASNRYALNCTSMKRFNNAPNEQNPGEKP